MDHRLTESQRYSLRKNSLIFNLICIKVCILPCNFPFNKCSNLNSFSSFILSHRAKSLLSYLFWHDLMDYFWFCFSFPALRAKLLVCTCIIPIRNLRQDLKIEFNKYNSWEGGSLKGPFFI